MPAVISTGFVQRGQGSVVVVIRENAITGVPPNAPPILRCPLGLPVRSSTGRDQCSPRVQGTFRCNVNYSINGVSAPERRARPADHFDPVNILERHVLRVPVHSPKKRGIDRTP